MSGSLYVKACAVAQSVENMKQVETALRFIDLCRLADKTHDPLDRAERLLYDTDKYSRVASIARSMPGG